MIVRVKQSRAIHTDDTPVPVQSPGEKQCRKGRIGCYLGDDANQYSVYDDTPNRSRDGPARWLRDDRGYLQADAYGGYNGNFAHGGLTEVASWARAPTRGVGPSQVLRCAGFGRQAGGTHARTHR